MPCIFDLQENFEGIK